MINKFKKRIAFWIVIALLYSIVLPNTFIYHVNAQSNSTILATYNPTEDTYIRNGKTNGNTNYGTAADLQVKRDDGTENNRSAFLKFDYSGFTDMQNVKQVKIRLYITTNGQLASKSFKLYAVPYDSWTESTLTWNNGSSIQDTLIDTFDLNSSEYGVGSWYEMDITEYIKSHMGDKKVSFRLDGVISNTSGHIYFSSRNAATNKPELVFDSAEAPVKPKAWDDLWLRYNKISDEALLKKYQENVTGITAEGDSSVLNSAKIELATGLSGLLDQSLTVTDKVYKDGTVVIGSPDSSNLIKNLNWNSELASLGDEGFIIRSAQVDGKKCTVIAGLTDQGILYGAFQFLGRVQRNESIENLNISDKPSNNLRLLNHWDNWDGSIERGYSGRSIWNWELSTDSTRNRYRDYARACASIGINGAVINNVNAQYDFIKTENLPKVAELAEIFREYGITLYVTVLFDSPMGMGGLTTADPLDSQVQQWWVDKANEIYGVIPDFGGFLVKADSEGRPGPLQYGRTQSEGANVLADALKPHNGIVMWRGFVYHSTWDPDRIKQSYQMFAPEDGKFRDNVIVQVKNGPLDFQVREPVSPLIGALPQTSTGIELQITQEYTGQSTHLCWLVPQWKEIFDFDTKVKGNGTTIKKIIDGTAFGYDKDKTLVAGVANIGSDYNWTGHYLAQANWYGFGRLAWNPDFSADQISNEWVKMTYNSKEEVVDTIGTLLKNSWKVYESYTSPVGLGFTSSSSDHFSPAVATRTSFTKADASGVGYNRTRETGSQYVDQYAKEVADIYNNSNTCPEELILWFHHLPYTFMMKSGKTLIQSMYDGYFGGVADVLNGIQNWRSLNGKIDDDRYSAVLNKMIQQYSEAIKWKNNGTQYFYNLSGIADELNRTDAAPPVATVETAEVNAGSAVTTAKSTKPGKIYLIPEGTYANQYALEAAVNGQTGTSAVVDNADKNTTITAPLTLGNYKLYAADLGGVVSAASTGTITVANIPVDTQALQQAIGNAEALKSEDYTADSYLILQEAVARGKALVAAPTTQAAVDTAVSDIQAAISSLKPVEQNEEKEFSVETVFNLGALEGNKTLIANVTAANSGNNAKDVLIIVALYDGADTMTDVSYVTKNVQAGQIEKLRAGFRLPNNTQDYKARVFVWDGTNIETSDMNPISNVSELH